MRLIGQVIDCKVRKGVSRSTGNPYEMYEYTLIHTDAQGHNSKLTFAMSREKAAEANIRRDEMVEVSYTLGIREYNGNTFNQVMGVYYVGKAMAAPGAQQSTAASVATGASAPVAGAVPQPSVAAPAQVMGTDELPF